MAEIVLFGATGYTGRLVAAELVRLGEGPVLAGRDARRLAALAAELGGLETGTADVDSPGSIADLLDAGDVLVTTVGPFARMGQPAAAAAVARRATYLDSTGESEFLRGLVDRLGSKAAASGTALVPAFGYDYVPGNLAGAIALERAGRHAARVDVGYFAPGAAGLSGGTVASAVGMSLMPSFRFRHGELGADRLAARTRSFTVGDRSLVGVAMGGSEHLFLPALAPGLQEVGVYLGWFGRVGQLAPVTSVMARGLAAVPGLTPLLSGAALRLRGSEGGPDADARAGATSLVVAEASDGAGALLARVELKGPDPYTLTGRLLAWAAVTARDGGLVGAGVLGPVQAFGLAKLADACAGLGLAESPAAGT